MAHHPKAALWKSRWREVTVLGPRLYVVEGKTEEEKGNLKDLCSPRRAFRFAA